MVYTEIQKKGKNIYYYRTKSIRNNKKFKKIRVFLGKNLSKTDLKRLEEEADNKIAKSLNKLLSKEEIKFLEKLREEHKKEEHSIKYESFISKFTYDSNAIEGNTLTLKETSLIIFDKTTPKGKSLREINEVINHKEAFDYMTNYKGDINQKFICEIQKIIIKKTVERKELEKQIGKYRTLQVYIRGTELIPPKPKEVEKEMKKLLRWYNKNKEKLNPLILTAYFHTAFEAIHPFFDGNGRTGRLLMNFILHKKNYPMINIPNKNRLEYYTTLEKAQKGNLEEFVKFLLNLMKNKINLY